MMLFKMDTNRGPRTYYEVRARQPDAICLLFWSDAVVRIDGDFAVSSWLFCRWPTNGFETLEQILLKVSDSTGRATVGDPLLGDLLADLSIATAEILSCLFHRVKTGRARKATLAATFRGLQG